MMGKGWMDMHGMEDMNPSDMWDEMWTRIEGMQKEMRYYADAGREITQIQGPPGIKRGDVIDVYPTDEEDELAEETAHRAKVLFSSPAAYWHDGSFVQFSEALVVILLPGEEETREEWAATYGEIAEESCEPGATEAETRTHCECGALIEKCERNQDLFGTHLNE